MKCRFFRHMRTTQERRRWHADSAEVKLRLRRGPVTLRSAWDDVMRRPQRSWKAHRKVQWVDA
jgi:hypothetical protein